MVNHESVLRIEDRNGFVVDLLAGSKDSGIDAERWGVFANDELLITYEKQLVDAVAGSGW